MSTTFDDADLSFDDDDGDVVPSNDVAATREYHPVNISSDAFWDQDAPVREKVYAQLRATAPVTWQPALETTVVPDPDDPGFWAVVKHEHITEISQHNDVFVSSYGVMADMLPSMFLEMAMSFLAMDNPQHDKIRKLVSAAFTPKQIRKIENDIAARAHRIVSAVADRDEIDFVADIARHLPIEMYGDMFGIPEDRLVAVGHAADEITAWADPELLAGRDPAEVQTEAALFIHDLAEELIADRRENPKNDLVTNLVQAEVDGEKLTDFEIGAVMTLFSVAATDTTRHTTSFAVKALTDFPEQRAWLWEDFEGRINQSIEEFLRWGSVVLTFRRTAVAEYELGGQQILPGDKVVMMYGSGNWDTEVFDDPDTFDLQRSPNPHVVFGGGGVHYCLGNQLAKSMMRSLFRELHQQMPDFVAGEPKLMRTNFMRGVLEMPFYPHGRK
ncbi:MAG TPA: cytochrome P450 [Gordonia polyisoprenivorans]|uniref:cytochrome P450 n=1 Tax=Gordonia polyisoprenivorans TaxID=84595 RepID=UPI000B99F2AD|nr:cytochrome P450 [Gordonia polyisoprenivorans]OZC29218.1 cytochrome P450 [Gordonia polyisoprenivorans]HCS58708.1 cytochrome P450 [Gordonia polyisoprenivorans]